MKVRSVRIRRAAALALVVATFVASAPGVAHAADLVPDTVPEQRPDTPDAGPDVPSERPPPDDPPPEEPPPASGEMTTLLLQPVCTDGDLQRFTVTHMAGPATRFTVSVAGAPDAESLSIAVGETRYFWVQAAAAVEITWTDGSASAAPAIEACSVTTAAAPEAPPPEARSSTSSRTPAEPDAAATPAPPAAGEPEATAAPPRSERSAGPVAAPAAPPGEDESDGEPAPPGEAAPQDQSGDDAPRPRREGPDGAYVCPEGWVPVDSDDDARIEPSDACEVLVATGARGGPARAPFATAALLVTVGLLLASIAVGAVRGGRTSALPGRAPSRRAPRPPAR